MRDGGHGNRVLNLPSNSQGVSLPHAVTGRPGTLGVLCVYSMRVWIMYAYVQLLRPSYVSSDVLTLEHNGGVGSFPSVLCV